MSKTYIKLKDLITEYRVLNVQSLYKPVAVGKYGIRSRESIYSKELANDYSKNKLIYKGTLTIGMGSKQIDIGILSEDVIYSVSPAYHTYYINGIDFNYLRYCLECRNRDMFIRYAKRGTRQGKTINFSDWLEYEIPVHDETTQLEIVFILDKVTHTIDLCNAILEKLDLLVKSRFVEMFGDVILNPLNWDTLTLNDICVKITDGEHGSVERSEEGYPFLNAKHITKSGDIDWNTVTYVSEDIHKKVYARCNPSYDDILMTTTGTIGNLTIVPNCGEFSMDRGITLLKLNHNKVCSAFVYCYLQSKAIQDIMVSNVHASAIGHLFINQVMKIPMYLPPLALQEQFADFVEQTDKSKLAVKQVLEKAETLKKALMQEYFG